MPNTEMPNTAQCQHLYDQGRFVEFAGCVQDIVAREEAERNAALDLNTWNVDLNTVLHPQPIPQPQDVAPSVPFANSNAMFMDQGEELTPPIPELMGPPPVTNMPELFQPTYSPRVPTFPTSSNVPEDIDVSVRPPVASVDISTPSAPFTYNPQTDRPEQFPSGATLDIPQMPYHLPEDISASRKPPVIPSDMYPNVLPALQRGETVIPRTPAQRLKDSFIEQMDVSARREKSMQERKNFLDNLAMAAYWMTPVYSKDRSAHMRGGLEMMQKRRELKAEAAKAKQTKAPTTKWRPVPNKEGWEQEYSWSGTSWEVIPGTQRPRHKPRVVNKQLITYTKPDGTPGRAYVDENTDMSQYPNWQPEKTVVFQPTATQAGGAYAYTPGSEDMRAIATMQPKGVRSKPLTKEQNKSIRKLYKEDSFFDGKTLRNSNAFNLRISDYMGKGEDFQRAIERAKADLELVEKNTFSADVYDLKPMQEIASESRVTPSVRKAVNEEGKILCSYNGGKFGACK